MRERRRGVARRVEAEASGVEAYWRQAWATHFHVLKGTQEARQEDSDMDEAREEETQPEDAESVEVQPMTIEDAQDEVGALPQLVEQEEEDSDSDSDSFEVEDIVTPEDDVIPVAVVDSEADAVLGVDTALVVPPSKMDELDVSPVVNEEGDFEIM